MSLTVQDIDLIQQALQPQFDRVAREVHDLRADMDLRFKQVDQRFEKIEVRLDKIEIRLDEMDKRFEKIELRLDVMDKRFIEVDKHFVEINRRFEQIDIRLEQIDLQFVAIRNQLRTFETVLYGVRDSVDGMAREVGHEIFSLFPMRTEFGGLTIRVDKLEIKTRHIS